MNNINDIVPIDFDAIPEGSTLLFLDPSDGIIKRVNTAGIGSGGSGGGSFDGNAPSVSPGDVSLWTPFNAPARVEQAGEGIFLQCDPINATQIRGITRPIPSANFTLTTRFKAHVGTSGFQTAGPILVDLATQKNFRHSVAWTQDQFEGARENSYTSYNSTFYNWFYFAQQHPQWYRVVDDGVHRTHYVSFNGYNWDMVQIESVGDFLIPTAAGFSCNAQTSTLQKCAVEVISWEVVV